MTMTDSWKLWHVRPMAIRIGVSGGEVRWIPIPTLTLAEKYALARLGRCVLPSAMASRDPVAKK